LTIMEMGRVNPRSLFARFSFTRNELDSAGATWVAAKRKGPATKPDEMRTYVHELTHYQQLTTTPYGLFLQYCKLLQKHAAVQLVKTLLGAGYPITPPLLFSLPPKMPPKVAENVGHCVSGWWNTENLVAALDGNRARRMALQDAFVRALSQAEKGANPTLPYMNALWRTFPLVQDSLAHHIAESNELARKQGHPVPVYPDNIDRTAITAALSTLPNDRDRAIGGLEIGLATTGNLFDVDAIVESQATAAEFWESDVTYETFADWVHSDADRDLTLYRTCLEWGLKAIKTSSLPSFLASYLTLCELVLFPPLLPQHAALRASNPGLEQLLPNMRFPRLMFAASRITPMQAMWDHDRYVADLIQDVGWVHPMQIVKSAMDGPQAVSNPVTFIYLQAQRWRGQRGSTFIGVDPLLFDSSPTAQLWRHLFGFVIMDFKDRTTYHPDKDFLQSMTAPHLSLLGLEALMLRDSLAIEAPYGRSPAENQWMTERLRGQFKDWFSRDFPDLQIVPQK
jgi:hypothetical protein